MDLKGILNLEFFNTKIKNIEPTIKRDDHGTTHVYFHLNKQKDFIVISLNKERIILSYRISSYDYYSTECTDESFQKIFKLFKDKLIESITRLDDKYFSTLNNKIFNKYRIFI